MLRYGCDEENKRITIIQTRAGYLLPGMALDLWKFKFCVVWIHLSDLFSSRCTKYFDDFDQLIDTGIARKNRLAQQ